MDDRQQLIAEVIAECVRDVHATRETNDAPDVRYELGLAASSLVMRVAPSFGVEPADVVAVLERPIPWPAI